jgi:hypothetical protein
MCIATPEEDIDEPIRQIKLTDVVFKSQPCCFSETSTQTGMASQVAPILKNN